MLKQLISLDNPFRLLYHKSRAIIANIYYGFPSKKMIIIWVTWTNGKTTTSNIIAKWLRDAWKKVFMFSTVNIIINDSEYTNNTKMTSPDAFELQRLLKLAKNEWCEIAVIETASHGIKMHRVRGIDYDVSVLTNITQDHLDLHKTMKDYVNTKLQIFKHLIGYKRKPWIKKTAVINSESDYKELFLAETYDSMFVYWNGDKSNLKAINVVNDINGMSFDIEVAWPNIHIDTHFIGSFNISNILAAVGVFISFWIESDMIPKMIKNITWVPWRLDEVLNNKENFKVFIDYAHTPDALEKVLETLSDINGRKRIITVFWATWDRDKTKRPIMWEIVSRLSDIVILTQDDDYTEKTEDIIKDVLPWIERKESEDFWIITNRKEAITTALLMAEENDIVLIAWKWDEHMLITNKWPVEWHDKAVVNEILKWIDDNKILK